MIAEDSFVNLNDLNKVLDKLGNSIDSNNENEVVRILKENVSQNLTKVVID